MSKLSKNVRFNFYELESEFNLSSFLDELSRNYDDKDSVFESSESFYRLGFLKRASKSSQLWFGQIVKIQMSAVPSKADINLGKIKEVDLGADEGIAETAYFSIELKELELPVLVFHQNSDGPSYRTLIRFLNHFWSEDSITCSPIVSRTRFERITEIKKFKSVSLVCSANASVVSNEGAFGDSLDELEECGIPVETEMKIKLSLDEVSGNNVKQIQSNIKKRFGLSLDNVKSLKVSGVDDEGNTSTLDMTDAKFYKTMRCELRKPKRFDDEEMCGALKTVFFEAVPELHEIMLKQG